MTRIQVIRGDITAQAVDAIVNADIRLIAFYNDTYSAIIDALQKES